MPPLIVSDMACMANSIGEHMACTNVFQTPMLRSRRGTYVPGFWSWKGLVSTVLTLMIVVVCEEDEEEEGYRV